MDAQFRKCHVLAVIAWAIFIAGLLWLPMHYLLPAAGAAHHDLRLLATLLASFLVLALGWTGFRSICDWFQTEP